MYQFGKPKTIMAKVIAAADGSPITSDVSAFHISAGGNRAAVAGTAASHVANGVWRYTPTITESQNAQFGIEFYHVDAVGNGPVVQVFTVSVSEQIGPFGMAWCRVEIESTATLVKLSNMLPSYHDSVGTPDAFVDGMLMFTTGANAGMSRRVTGFEGLGSGHWEITVSPALTTAPSNNDECLLIPFGMLLAGMVSGLSTFDATTDTVTLTAAYDAAKTAAQAGDAMTLAADQAVNVTKWGGTAIASANVLIDGAITATKIAASALNGKGDWNTTTPLTASGVRNAVGLNTANLDTQLSGLAAKTDIPGIAIPASASLAIDEP